MHILPDHADSDQPPAGIGWPSTAPYAVAQLLGLPHPDKWAELTSHGALSRPQHGALLYLYDAGPLRLEIPVGAGVLSADWDGYGFDVFGRLLSGPPSATDDWPCWEAEDRGIYLQGWRWRIARRKAPFSVDLLWAPQLGIRKSVQIHRDPPRWDDQYFRDASKAMRLLHTLPLRSPPRRTKPRIEEHPLFRQRMREADRLLKNNAALGDEELAAQVGNMPVRTFQVWRKRWRELQIGVL